MELADQDKKSKVICRPMLADDAEEVTGMMKQLWALDPDGEKMTDKNAQRAIYYILKHPDNGCFHVFCLDGTIIGYGFLVYYYSSVHYGLIWNIEEIFVMPAHRSRRIATQYIEGLKKEAQSNIMVAALAVQALPYNKRAKALYIRLGFVPTENGFEYSIPHTGT